MNWILKNKNFLCGNRLFKGFAGIKNILKGKRIKTLFVVLFLVFAFLGSFQFAHAGVGDAIGGIFTDGIRYVLTQLNAFMGWLFAAAATLFAVVVDPNNISGSKGILNKQAVKDVWIMVRDTLNMAFIVCSFLYDFSS
jgi:hypothetical protein